MKTFNLWYKPRVNVGASKIHQFPLQVIALLLLSLSMGISEEIEDANIKSQD